MTYLERTRRVRANGRSVASTMTVLAMVAGVAGMTAVSADGRPAPRGGGGGISRPSGGGMIGGIQRPNRSSMPQLGTNGSSRNNRSKATANGNRTATSTATGNSRYARNGNNGAVGTANTNTGAVGNGNANGNSGVVNNGNVGSGNVNTGNVVAGNDVNVAVDNGWNGWENYPAGAYATGVAVGTTTTAVARTYSYSLPPTCSPYVWNSMNYYNCGGTWYQTQYQGGQTVYVAVSNPTNPK